MFPLTYPHGVEALARCPPVHTSSSVCSVNNFMWRRALWSCFGRKVESFIKATQQKLWHLQSLFNWCSLLKCPESLAIEGVWPNSALVLLWVMKVHYSQRCYVESEALSLLLYWLPASPLLTFRRLIWGDQMESNMDDVVLHKNVAAWQKVPNVTNLDAVSNSVES